MLFRESTKNGDVIRDYDINFTDKSAVKDIVKDELKRIHREEETSYAYDSYTVAVGSHTVSYEDLRPFSYVNRLGHQAIGEQLIYLFQGQNLEEDRRFLYDMLRKLESDPDLLKRFLSSYHPDILAFRELLPYIELVFKEERTLSETEGALANAKNRLWRVTKRFTNEKHPKVSLSSYSYAIKNIEAFKKRIKLYQGEITTATLNSEIEEGLGFNFRRI